MILTMVAAIAANAAQPQTVATIDPKHRLVEGVGTDGTTIWASSVLDRTIVACRATCRDLAVLPSGLHPMGISWDSRRQRLWVAADCPKLPGVEACERGALVSLDRRGRVRTRIAPAVGAFHPGDVSSSGGAVFVSDSKSGAVYALDSTGRYLRAAVAPGVGKSAQGTALDPAGKQLIVADYSQGIASIDRQGGARTLLPRQDGKPLRGVDGLVRCGDIYLGIYNGAEPGRLLTIKMRPGGVEYGELIEGFTMPDPTQIAFDGKRLLIVSNAGWGAANKESATPREPAPIVAIPLSKDCKPL